MSQPKIEAIYPLSPLQQGLLFHALYDPNSPLYRTQVWWKVHGKLETEALHQAWQVVADRHAVFRTSILAQQRERPLQVVRAQVVLPWREADFSSLDAEPRELAWRELLNVERAQAFDFASAPLMRWVLARWNSEEYRLLWTHHHILLDGWSVQLILREVQQAYRQLQAGVAPQFEPVTPFRDYLCWLQSKTEEDHRAFWRELLAGISEPTPLRMASRRETAKNAPSEPGRIRCTLDRASSNLLRDFSKSRRLSLNSVVQGAWALLLSRYSGTDDVLYGTTFSGRPPELAGVDLIVGLLINTLPARIRVLAEERAEVWLHYVQERLLEIREREFTPLTEVQACAEIPRGQSLFDTLFVFENYPLHDFSAEENSPLRFGDIEFLEQSNFALTMVVVPGPEIVCELTFDTRFDRAMIERMLGHYRVLLETMPGQSDATLRELSILTAEERRLLLDHWAQCNVPYPRDASVPELFHEQARARGDQVALLFEGRSVSYAELDRWSDRMADELQRLGVGAEVMVGVCLERSWEMVMVLLAILKAGGAYVPLDPSYPKNRLEFMLADTHAPLLITQKSLASRFASTQTHRLVLEEWFDSQGSLSAIPAGQSRIEPHPKSDHAAYVIYTSGSTGKPKGVIVSHRNIIRLVKATQYAALDCSQIFLQYAPISFDAATFEIWAPLLNGARLVIAPPGQLSLEELDKLIGQHRISTLWLTASLFHLLMEERPEALRGVAQVLAGGEALCPRHVAEFLRRYPTQRLINGYGPTENTTFSCCATLQLANAEQGRVPIGRPIANSQAYILDEQLQPVPIGVPGELFLGGDGLARGYLNEPELTRQKFIAHPFDSRPGARLYRTGDLARYLADGQIEFLGRLDHQIKIRGFRVELGEIEAVLSAHPAVAQAVIMMHEPERHLVAYWSARNGLPEPTAAQLRLHLQEHLPEYMLPGQWVQLERLPLSPNGKIDRQALALRPAVRAPQSGRTLPRDQTEERLAAIWRDVLGLEQVAMEENFFDLGGHSLLATQVISRVNKAFGLELPLRVLFEAGTIEGLAARISGNAARPQANAIRKRLDRLQAEQLLARIDSLSESDLESWLNTPS
ncbi:MAG: amino acid adenylation domain-containing protein [Verrucomicrobiota bacterium]